MVHFGKRHSGPSADHKLTKSMRQACWSNDGTSVYVGRSNASLDVYDIRAGKPRTISLPSNSGQISSIAPLPQSRQVLLASSDTVRLWDPHKNTFTIVSTVQSGCTSLAMDIRGSYLFSVHGGKGWVDNGPQEVACYEVIGA